MSLENLKSFEEYLEESSYNEYDNELNEDEDEDNLIYHDGELMLVEAGPRLNAKQRQKAEDIGQLMTAMNKRQGYIAAKDKFVKVFHKEAKAVAQDLKLNPMVLKKLDKITLRDL